MTDTVIIRGIEFDVEFDYQPEEKAVMYYSDGSGYPGCGEAITYAHIELMGIDFDEFFEKEWEVVENAIWEKLHTIAKD